ncbi:MAG: hypothetical protein FWF63_00685 [Fibromonadales bacterium]|nr:hypothetical protein [Fibromonadales bacterium]
MKKQKSKVPDTVHILLKYILNITRFNEDIGEYVPNYKLLHVSFSKEEYEEILGFVQTVSAGEL